MKISYNWLKNYIDLRESPQKVAEALTMGIAEVENITDQKKGLEGVVVGEILEVKKHPNADKLNVAKINIGKKIIQVIFGQVVRLKVGDRLPIAVAPTVLPSGLKIEKRKLRGIDSQGMCCLNSELGILDKSDNVNFFSKEAKPGTKIINLLSLDDAILEIDNKSLNHRSDLFSHVGIARELAAVFEKKLKLPKLKKPKTTKEKTLKVKVQNFDDCPRYMDIVLDNIQIKPSPEWMQKYLQNVGVRPINNVIDITNFVMLEYGQPTHAFDYDKIKNQTFYVRRAKSGEKITTLDNVNRNLDESILIIEDGEKIIDLAGIMGGAISEIDKNTKTIVLEAANFNKTLIRKTANKLDLRTEAAIRYEKGLSLDLAWQAMWRGVELFKKYAGAKVTSPIYDLKKQTPKEKKIKLDLDYLNRFIGANIPRQKVIKILKSLEFKISGKGEILNVTVPLFRTDINLPEDLIEEVTRIHGYEKIKSQPICAEIAPVQSPIDLLINRKISEYLTDWGFMEVYNYSFYGEKLLKKCNNLTSKNHWQIQNPLSPEVALLRNSLIPRLLENLEKNSRGFDSIKIFESGHFFRQNEERKIIQGVILDGKDVFYQAKGLAELIMKKFNINFEFTNIEKDATQANYFDRHRALRIKSGDKLLGAVAEIDKRILENFDLSKKHVGFFGFRFERMAELFGNVKKYKPLPKYPPVMTDLAFVLDKNILAKEIENTLYQSGQPFLKNIELFDVYEGKPLLPHEKNLAFHLTYRAENKTLKDEEVKAVQEKIVKVLENKFKAKIRKF